MSKRAMLANEILRELMGVYAHRRARRAAER